MPKYGGNPRRRLTRAHAIVTTTVVAAALVGGSALASSNLSGGSDDDTAASRQIAAPNPFPGKTPAEAADPEPDPARVTPRPKPTPTPTPTPTPSETTEEPPSPMETQPHTADPQPVDTGDFPNEDTTGVPAGTDLKASDSITVTEDGAVIDGLDINGIVRIQADDVTIRRSRIVSTGRYAIEVEGGRRNLVVEDTEIDGNGVATIAILRDEFTLRRVDIHGVRDGPRIEGDNVLIEDSYLHDLHRIPGGHHDVLQMRQGSNVVIRNNNLQAYNAKTGDPMNAVIQFGSALGPINKVLFEGNLMNGGNYTVNGGDVTGNSLVFRGNRFGRDFRYGVVAGAGAMVWEANVFDDNSEPAR